MTSTATVEREPEVVTQGLGGQPTTGEPQPKTAKKAEPKIEAPRYAPNTDELSATVLKSRELVGRKNLAEFAGQSQSCIWRWERSRVHPDERPLLVALVGRIEAGELPVPEPKARGKVAEAVAILHEAKGSKIGKAALIDQVLAVLDPQ